MFEDFCLKKCDPCAFMFWRNKGMMEHVCEKIAILVVIHFGEDFLFTKM